MENLRKLNKYSLPLILCISFFLRFVNYGNRWGLAIDQSRDVTVSTFALTHHLIPIIGPFSSAGKFVYGPELYWLISLFVSVYPKEVLTPWIIQSLLFVFITFVMYLIGKEVFNKNFGLLLSFLTAISTSQLAQSTNLTSPSLAGIFSVFCLYFFVRFIKYSKKIDAFFLGFLVATTINIHFQAIGLLSFLLLAWLFGKKEFKQTFLMFLGFLLPFAPLMIFELKTNFFETRNVLDYYLYGQQKIYIPNRWLTYLGVFWPKSWAEIIGGNIIFGYLITGLAAIFFLYGILKRKISRETISIIIVFLVILTMLRYYKGIIFGGYLVFIHPLVLFITSWVLYEIYKIRKVIALGLLLAIVFVTFLADYNLIVNATNKTAIVASTWQKQLIKKFPNQKFAVYNYKYFDPYLGYSLVMYLNAQGKIDDKGRKIGVANFEGGIGNHPKMRSDLPVLTKTENSGSYEIYDLDSSSSATLIKDEWLFINPSEIYKSTVEWYFDKETLK